MKNWDPFLWEGISVEDCGEDGTETGAYVLGPAFAMLR